MKRVFLAFALTPFICFADLTSEQSSNLQQIRDAWWAVDSSSDYSNAVGMRLYFTQILQSVPSWGGNFFKTVGNFASAFYKDFTSSNGWFANVKAYISDIQAKVGRIETAIGEVKGFLESVDRTAELIRDTLESIETTVDNMFPLVSQISTDTGHIRTDVNAIRGDVSDIKAGVSSIDSNVSKASTDIGYIRSDVNTIKGFASSILSGTTGIHQKWDRDIVQIKQWLNPEVVWADGTYGFDWSWQFLRAPNEAVPTPLTIDDFEVINYFPDDSLPYFSRLEQYLQMLLFSASLGSDISVNSLVRQSVEQYSLEVLTNTTQQILNTNSFWYAKIYDRIPTNLTVTVSNIVSSASNDWSYVAAVGLSSAPVLNDLSPDIGRDVNHSHALVPPALTGDFKRDVILLLANMQQIASSSSSVDMDILTNVQVVAASILSASSVVSQKSDEVRDKARQIAEDGSAHEHDLDSAEQYFNLIDGNSSASIVMTQLNSVGDSLSPLVSATPSDMYSFVFPAFSPWGSGQETSLQADVDFSPWRGFFDNVRLVFAFFWFGLIALFVWRFFLLGIRLLGWISSLINPFQYNAGLQGHDLTQFA